MWYVGLGPSNCACNHNRRCANDNGTRPGRSRRVRPAREVSARLTRTASSAGVGASNNARTPSSTPNTDRTRDTNRIANSE